MTETLDASPIEVVYRNHRGEVATRRILPWRVYWGATEYHPTAQWLLECWDVEKGAKRTFALADCDFDQATW
jgi:predicted DNA-binding transcriptional regulator YafY